MAAKAGFDLVLASDVTHFSLMHEPLACTISRMLRPAGGVCLLSHQQRMVNLKGQDMQLCEFEQVARSHGLQAGSIYHPIRNVTLKMPRYQCCDCDTVTI